MEELTAYPGTYYSPELGVSYSVTLQEDQLLLQRRKHGTGQLKPAFTDGFTGDVSPASGNSGGMNIAFEREDGKNVVGFRLSTNRVRRLRFVKGDA